jgi:hypothetical protein
MQTQIVAEWHGTVLLIARWEQAGPEGPVAPQPLPSGQVAPLRRGFFFRSLAWGLRKSWFLSSSRRICCATDLYAPHATFGCARRRYSQKIGRLDPWGQARDQSRPTPPRVARRKAKAMEGSSTKGLILGKSVRRETSDRRTCGTRSLYGLRNHNHVWSWCQSPVVNCARRMKWVTVSSRPYAPNGDAMVPLLLCRLPLPHQCKAEVYSDSLKFR